MKLLKNSYLTVLLAWLIAIILSITSSNGIIAALTLFFTGLLPFIFILLWLAKSKTGESIRGYFSKWHTGIMLIWFLFAYSIYAKKWAAAFINDIFHVDANSLGITYTLLAALFTPLGILYQGGILASLWITVIVIAIFLMGILPFLLLLPIKFKTLAAFTGTTFLVVFLSSVFIGITAGFASNKELLVTRFALWADFNEKHLCTNDWSNRAQSVLFLGGDRVLAYIPGNPQGSRYVPETCDFAKKI